MTVLSLHRLGQQHILSRFFCARNRFDERKYIGSTGLAGSCAACGGGGGAGAKFIFPDFPRASISRL